MAWFSSLWSFPFCLQRKRMWTLDPCSAGIIKGGPHHSKRNITNSGLYIKLFISIWVGGRCGAFITVCQVSQDSKEGSGLRNWRSWLSFLYSVSLEISWPDVLLLVGRVHCLICSVLRSPEYKTPNHWINTYGASCRLPTSKHNVGCGWSHTF